MALTDCVSDKQLRFCTGFSQPPRRPQTFRFHALLPHNPHSSISGTTRIFKGKEPVRGEITMVPAALCCKKWLNYASSFFSPLSLSLPLSLFPWKKKIYISNNLSKLKDKSGPSVLGNVLSAAGTARATEPVPSSGPRAKPGLRRPAARGGYAPRGSCPASSGRQSASGRSGPVGRTVGGSDAGRRHGPREAP